MAPTHPAVGGGSNPQIQQFLSNVLSQRGPTALPYSEDVKWLIRQHLVSLSDNFPSLVPKTATFTHNDGRSVNLLQADGTVPMSYQGVTYNIPVIIWLMESYPRHAPCVYVNPTRDMIIKRPHPHVDPSGLVRIPYLQNWIYPSSNLVELARNLGSYFVRDPPLYSQRSNRTNPNHNPNPNLSASTGSVISSGSSSFSAASAGSTLDESRPPVAHNYPPSPYLGSGAGRTFPPSPQVRPPHQTEDPSEVFKRNAISKIMDNANGYILALRKTRETEMDGLANIQQTLRRRAGEVDRGLKEMQGEKEALEQQLQMVLMNSDVLESWLRENEAKMTDLGRLDVNVDEVFQPCDVLSKQMLECAHSDLAIEDVIYSLDKAVQDGAIPFDMYLRNVRLLSREQFINRALGSKVRGAQMQAQVASMAARAQQYTR